MSDTPTTVHKFAAEAIGTFVLVLVGCGAFVISDDLPTTGLAFGLSLMVITYAFGRISGGHFNPAVSIGSAMGGRMAWNQVPVYVGAQLVGAILGAGVLLILLLGIDGFEAFDDPIGANRWGDNAGATGYALWSSLVLELILTAIFVFVVLAVTDERNEHPAMAPLAVGLALSAIYFFSVPVTGGSVNPARSIGPALFSGTDPLIELWVFIVGPLLGAAAAGLAYPALFGHAGDRIPGSGLTFGGNRAAAVPGYGAPDAYQQQWNQQPAAGYQPPAAGYQAATPTPTPTPTPQQAQPAYEQPIIQDGWQWDPQAQQWIPAQQQPVQPQAQGWPAPDPGGQTQVRPPDGQ